jgi:acetolactate synthase-1/2/3 large subunit
MPASESIERAAAMLRSGLRTAIILGGNALYGRGLEIAGRISAGTNAKLLSPYPVARVERGTGVASVERINYVLEQALEQLREFRQFILVGTRPPVAYFAYHEKNSVLVSADSEMHSLARAGEDLRGALEALASTLPLRSSAPHRPYAEERPVVPSGTISTVGVASAIGALLPENSIVVDESMTSGRGLMAATRGAPRHDWLGNTGGSIGIALPLAVGAAVACPERPVLCLTADGSGMYTVQALWTMAREGLNITSVVFANRSYAVLKREFSYLEIGEPGRQATNMFEIGRPDIDWVLLARSMGVPASRPTSVEAFGAALHDALASKGPMLIQVDL